MLKCGFFDSINGDRKYNSKDIAQIFDGIIVDGIYAQVGNHFSVNIAEDEPMTVIVDTGQAWLNHTKIINTSQLRLHLDAAQSARYNTIVIEVNELERTGDIYIKKGTSTAPPALTNNEYIHQYTLAQVFLKPGATSITQANIASKIGFAIPDGIPYVTCPLDPFPADETLKQWVAQWTEFYERANASFEIAQSDRETTFNNAQNQRENTFNTFMTESTNSYNALKLLFTNWLNTTETDWNTWFAGVKAQWEEFQNAIDNSISDHNVSETAHADIRDLISDIATRLNALADSDDTTLDQLSEIVVYIKSNRDLIDAITTSKVSVSDIVDNLTSSNTNKPLSANQGKVLKAALEDLKKSVSDGKTLVASAITEKGVTTAANATFATMAENIGQIETGETVNLEVANIDSMIGDYYRTIRPSEGFDGFSHVVLQGIPYQNKSVNPATYQQTVAPDSGKVLTTVTVNAMKLQEKTATVSIAEGNPAGTSTLLPDNGYDGLSKVNIPIIRVQSKTVTPSTSEQTITPESPYRALSSVTVSAANLQSKTFTPTSTAQTIKPDSGYYGLSQVTVNAGGEPSSVTITGELSHWVQNVVSGKVGTTKKTTFSKTFSIPFTSNEYLANGSKTTYLTYEASGQYQGVATVKITGISFDSASSISMIAEHMGVNLETAQQMYNEKNVLFELEEDESEISKVQKISEIIARSEKSVIQDEKLVSSVRDTAISGLAEEGGEQQ